MHSREHIGHSGELEIVQRPRIPMSPEDMAAELSARMNEREAVAIPEAIEISEGRSYLVDSKTLVVNDSRRHLKALEDITLRSLLDRRGEIVLPEELIAQLWSKPWSDSLGVKLSGNISGLRRKMRFDMSNSGKSEDSPIKGNLDEGYKIE